MDYKFLKVSLKYFVQLVACKSTRFLSTNIYLKEKK